jgi:glycosyltransferase involved in cell wall biosynthesis
VNHTLTILHIDSERSWGGGQDQLVELSRYLATRGHRQVVACRPDGALQPVLRAHGIAVSDLRIRNDMDLRAVWHLRKLLATRRFDVVHFHTARAHALAPWLPRQRRRFVVSRLMDYAPHFRPRVRYLYNRSVDGVIAISQAIADVLSAVGVDPRQVRVIHLGIDCSRFEGVDVYRDEVRSSWNAAAQDIVLFTAAVLEPRKGHQVLLDAFASLCRDGIPLRWVICGDGSLRDQLREQVAARGLSERVVFTGFSSEVPRLLAGADVFVLPSLHEGLGIAAMEAMAVALPVIASRIGGLPEIVVDGETGLLVPAGDAAVFATAIRRIAGDPAAAHDMGRRGRARAFDRFTSAAMAAAVEAYYYELGDRHTS